MKAAETSALFLLICKDSEWCFKPIGWLSKPIPSADVCFFPLAETSTDSQYVDDYQTKIQLKKWFAEGQIYSSDEDKVQDLSTKFTTGVKLNC